MARHDLLQDFLLHKASRPITCRALVIRQELFDGVIIEGCHVVPPAPGYTWPRTFTTSGPLSAQDGCSRPALLAAPERNGGGSARSHSKTPPQSAVALPEVHL